MFYMALGIPVPSLTFLSLALLLQLPVSTVSLSARAVKCR